MENSLYKREIKKTDEEIVILTAGEKDFCHYTSGRSRQNLWAGVEEEL